MAIISVAYLAAADGEEKKAECNFDTYRPLKIGAPIRGGHEDLALEKTSPVYPREALSKKIGGRVIVHILIDRAGDVVKACGVGPALLVTAAEEAVSKWKFRKDFGFVFAQSSPAASKYAELRVDFDFNSRSGQNHNSTDLSVSPVRCSQTDSATHQREDLIWLNSETLMRRVVQKAGLSFPALSRNLAEAAQA